MGFLAVTGCWFAISHCALNNSMTTSNTLLCCHVYIWSNCGHVDSTWHKVPWSLLHNKHRSESVYPHNFRLVAFGKRLDVEQRRNDIASGSIAIKDFHTLSYIEHSWIFIRILLYFLKLNHSQFIFFGYFIYIYIYIYIYVCMYLKQDLALNNLQGLCHKTQPTNISF